MNEVRPYVFFFPYRGVGGVPVLFLRLAEWMATNTNHPLYLIDYADGFMAKAPKNPKIQILNYEPDKSLEVPQNSLLVFQSDLPWGLPQNLMADPTVTAFFWNCYPFNLVPVLPGSAREWMSESLFRTKLVLNSALLPAKNKCKKFLELLLKRKAIAFMDGPNVQFTEKALGVNIEGARYIPILLPATHKTSQKQLDPSKPLVAAWVGRIADFKIYSLLHTLNKISEWALEKQKPFHFKIIGDGNRMDELKNSIPKNDFLKVELYGTKSPQDMESILLNDVDIVFAMGTSALEGARLGVPTVLLDFSYGPFPSNYNFNWIHESQNYSLGSPLDLLDLNRGKSFHKLVNELIADNSQIRAKGLEYFLHHHFIDRCMNGFLEASQASEFKYIEYLGSPMSKKPGYYRVWQMIKR